jgi:hypothetical protein
MKGICFRLGDRFFFENMTSFEGYFKKVLEAISNEGVYEFTTVIPIDEKILKVLDSILFLNIPYKSNTNCNSYICTDFEYSYNKGSKEITFYIKNIKKLDTSVLDSLYLLKQDYNERISLADYIPTIKNINRFYWYSE